MAVDIIAMLILVTMAFARQPRFVNQAKDQAALIEKLSAFLDRHHLWNQFLTEDAMGKR